MYHNHNEEKHCISARRLRRIRSKKARRLLACLAALLCVTLAGATVAFLITGTQPVTNVFENAYVACKVLENGSDENEAFDGKVKTNVRIQNTGDVQSYIRAKVVVTWMAIEDEKVTVTASTPIEGTDYTIVYAGENNDTDTNWKLAADGYWYYTVPVNVDDVTQDLIHSCSLKDGAVVPEGFYLSVEIVASSIQSTPVSVVTEQWKSDGDGVIGVDGNTLQINVQSSNE